MEKFFTSVYAPFLLLYVGLHMGIALTVDHLQASIATVGIAGIGVGMTFQIWKHYREGRCGVHWVVNTIMLVVVVMRSVYFIRTGQTLLAIPDVYTAFIMSIIQLQLAGYLLKKQPESE